MLRRWPIPALTLIVMAAANALVPGANAAEIRYRGDRAELLVSAISDRTIQIVLAPLDEKDNPRPATPSTVLVELKPEIKLQLRELTDAKEVAVGKLRVQVKPNPLTITVPGRSCRNSRLPTTAR